MLFNIKELRKNIKNLKVAVIGDYCLDQYWYMDSTFDKKLDYNEDITFALTNAIYSPGGAGNVINNFIKLGVNVKCIGLIGDDGIGYQLMKCLKSIGADTENMIRTKEKETHTCIRPIRIIDNQNISLNEIITSKFLKTTERIERQIVDTLKNIINDVDAFVLVEQFDDNNKGIFTDNIREEITRLSKIYKDKIFIVDSRKYIDKYINMYLKCNQYEFISTLNYNSTADINQIDTSELLNLINSLNNLKSIFITTGKDGMKVYNKDDKSLKNITSINVGDKINTCGAGDSATVGIVIGLCLGYNIYQSAFLGNIIASITIQDLHSTGSASVNDVIKIINKMEKERPEAL